MEKSVVENNEMESKGFELTLANPFFKDLIELMEEPKFTRFFNTYFKDMSDIKATLIYMKLYQLLQKKYKNITEKKLSSYVTIFILYNVMTNKSLRPKVLEETMKHLIDSKHPIFDLTPELIKDKKKKKKKSFKKDLL